MSYSSNDGRRQLLNVVASAVDRLAAALGLLSGAYELLDERTAEQLEERLFRPVQHAYGALRRTHAEFAARHGLPVREFVPAPQGAPARGLPGLTEAAAEAVAEADAQLAELQDSMLPVEVGDLELRNALAAVRTEIAPVGGATRQLLRTLGR